MTEYQKERQKIVLKPCPFCGGEARLKKHQKLKQAWYVQCNKCGIRTINSVQVPYESWKTTMNHPVQLWNQRAGNGNKAEESAKLQQAYSKGFEDCRQEVLKQLNGCLTGGETEYKYVKLHIDNIVPDVSC